MEGKLRAYLILDLADKVEEVITESREHDNHLHIQLVYHKSAVVDDEGSEQAWGSSVNLFVLFGVVEDSLGELLDLHSLVDVLIELAEGASISSQGIL